MKRPALLLISVLALAGLLAGCAEMPVAQQSTQPKKAAIGDIVGMKAAYLDSEMESRGFKNVDGYKSGDTSFTTWWNASTEQCFSVATRDGRVDELESIDKGECRGSAKASQKDAQTQKVNLDDMVGMKASYLDSDMESRGFKNVDGYKTDGAAYTIWWNASSQQCVSVATREGRVDKLQSVDTDECTHSAKASQRDAQATKVNLNDLLGMKAAFLDSEMESRGFKNVASHKTDDASVTTWWNASTKQCVSVGTRQGRVDTLKSISESNCQQHLLRIVKKDHPEQISETGGRIISAAVRLFSRQGYYHKTTIADLAGAIGQTSGAIYHHFAGKQDLLYAVVDWLARGLKAYSDAAKRTENGSHQLLEETALYSSLDKQSICSLGFLFTKGAGISDSAHNNIV